MELNKKVFVTRKEPVTTTYIPDFNCVLPVIWEREVLNKTPKGYRLSSTSSPDNGSFHSDADFCFFDTYTAALKFVAESASNVAVTLDKMKLKAERLESAALYELAAKKGGLDDCCAAMLKDGAK